MLTCLILNSIPTIVHSQDCDEYCYNSWEDFNLGISELGHTLQEMYYLGSMRLLKDTPVLKALVRQSIELESIWFGFRQCSVAEWSFWNLTNWALSCITLGNFADYNNTYYRDFLWEISSWGTYKVYLNKLIYSMYLEEGSIHSKCLINVRHFNEDGEW